MAEDLEFFGRLLMKEVRDRTISEYDRMISGALKSVSGKQIHALMDTFNDEQKEAVRSILLTQIDGVIHNFLWLIEKQGDSTFPLVLEGGAPLIDLASISDGLSGELYGDNGWIARYSASKSGLE